MLHIGGFRTALYAWLLARHHGGTFILRIEDTDRERTVEGAIRYIAEGFKWFGIEIDEGPSEEELKEVESDVADLPAPGGEYGPYVQSLRTEKYQEIADRLIDEGHAFRCDCTPEMLDKERAEQRARKEVPGYSGYCRTRNVSKDTKHVVRFKMPYKPELEMIDGIRGRISWDNVPLKDPIIVKSDGFPTYHLAAMVDDHEMKISHVLRGEEWIPSTPLHLLLYKALGWEPPIFCHLPVVLGSDGKKLSKRHGSTSWSSFRDEGYLPEALLNFVTLIGWSPGEGDEQEIFSREELIQKFSLDHVNPSSGVFEYNKLNWMNGVYIRALSDEKFKELALPFFLKQDIDIPEARWNAIAPHVKERVKLLSEVPAMVEFLQEGKLERAMDQMISKKVPVDLAKTILDGAIAKIEGLPDFTALKLEESLTALVEELELKMGPVFITLRIAVTGKKATPPLFESMEALGRDEVLGRMRETLQILEHDS